MYCECSFNEIYAKKNRFLSEIYEKYMTIVKSANLIGFLNRLANEGIQPIANPLTLTLARKFTEAKLKK